MDACFPAEDTPPAPLEGYAERVERYVGLYRGNRIAYSSIGKLNIINNLRRASASEDGLLNLDGDIYVETEPALFVNRQNPDDVIAFRLDESGTATHLLVGERPNQVWERVSWYQNPMLHAVVVVVALLFSIFSLILWSAGMVRGGGQLDGLAYSAHWFGLGASAAALVAILVLAAWLMLTNPALMAFGIPLLVRIALFVGTLFAVLTLVSVPLVLFLWLRGAWSVAGRLHFSLAVAMFLLLALVFWYWNLLPF
jgi:hypothetical protein